MNADHILDGFDCGQASAERLAHRAHRDSCRRRFGTNARHHRTRSRSAASATTPSLRPAWSERPRLAGRSKGCRVTQSPSCSSRGSRLTAPSAAAASHRTVQEVRRQDTSLRRTRRSVRAIRGGHTERFEAACQGLRFPGSVARSAITCPIAQRAPFLVFPRLCAKSLNPPLFRPVSSGAEV